MPSLQVRELPDQIYQKLVAESQKEHRSFSQQAIVTLARGLNMEDNPKDRRAKLINNLRELKLMPDVESLTDPAILIREDRER
jgi:plasmid stability protein